MQHCAGFFSVHVSLEWLVVDAFESKAFQPKYVVLNCHPDCQTTAESAAAGDPVGTYIGLK